MAVKINPGHSQAWYHRGLLIKSEFRDYHAAIKDFSRAIEADEKFTGAYIDRGVARGKLGNHEEAISDFTKAIRINGNNATAYHNRAVARKALNDEAGAKQDFHKAFELRQIFTNKGNAAG